MLTFLTPFGVSISDRFTDIPVTKHEDQSQKENGFLNDYQNHDQLDFKFKNHTSRFFRCRRYHYIYYILDPYSPPTYIRYCITSKNSNT